MKKSLSVFLFVIFFIPLLEAQKQANIWYFNHLSGLDFDDGEPSILISTFDIAFGCASISDSYGNFLFATDGRTIWNRNNEVMQNGNDLNDRGSYYGVLIVQICYKPVPIY